MFEANWTREIRAGSTQIACTLLIRPTLRDVFDERLAMFGGDLSGYLAWLLNRYRYKFANRGLPVSDKVTTDYQQRGLCPQAVPFRCDPLVWHELKAWSHACGVSACLLFNWLIMLEMLYGDDETRHIPDHFGSPWNLKRLVYKLLLNNLMMSDRGGATRIKVNLRGRPPD